MVQEEHVWRCAQCVGGEVYLPNSKRRMTFAPSPEMRALRGNCTGVFGEDMAQATGEEPDADGIITVSGLQVMAGGMHIKDARFMTCPNAYIDPLSPAFRGAPWLEEATEIAGALGLDLRLSDFAPDATGPMRELVKHVISERQRRSMPQ